MGSNLENWLLTRRPPVRTVRDAASLAVTTLEDERLQPDTRVQLALGLLRAALLYDREPPPDGPEPEAGEDG